jgi:hypothetical protein
MSYVVNPGSIKIAHRLIDLHPEWFAVLDVYDRTGKLPKFPTKMRVNFTIDEELFHRFRGICKERNLKMSQVVEKKISEFLEVREEATPRKKTEEEMFVE